MINLQYLWQLSAIAVGNFSSQIDGRINSIYYFYTSARQWDNESFLKLKTIISETAASDCFDYVLFSSYFNFLFLKLKLLPDRFGFAL